MFYVVASHTSRASLEKTWRKVLGTLNEYQARLFVAEKALELGRGGITRCPERDRTNRANRHFSNRLRRGSSSLYQATS